MPATETLRPSHQTVRIGRGRHLPGSNEVCVMELASMLAGEPFSDRPRSACPVLGALLRAYNDCLDDGRRQCLYPLASRVVGTRGDACCQERRLALLLEWCAARKREWPRWRRWLRPLRERSRVESPDAHARLAMRLLPKTLSDHDHDAVMELIERLLTVSLGSSADSYTVAGRGDRSPLRETGSRAHDRLQPGVAETSVTRA